MKQVLEARIKREKAMRVAQIEERRQLKEEDRQRRLAQEHIEIAQIQKLTIDDEEKRLMKREQQRRTFDAVKEEDERNNRIKEERLFTQREYESKLSKDYE